MHVAPVLDRGSCRDALSCRPSNRRESSYAEPLSATDRRRAISGLRSCRFASDGAVDGRVGDAEQGRRAADLTSTPRDLGAARIPPPAARCRFPLRPSPRPGPRRPTRTRARGGPHEEHTHCDRSSTRRRPISGGQERGEQPLGVDPEFAGAAMFGAMQRVMISALSRSPRPSQKKVVELSGGRWPPPCRVPKRPAIRAHRIPARWTRKLPTCRTSRRWS